MQLLLAAIGRLKPGPELALFDQYRARLPWPLVIKELQCKKPLAGEALKEQEAPLLLAAVKDAEHVIALDERGELLSSAAFASHLKTVRDRGPRHIAFIIGGADGLHTSVAKRAALSLSLGRLTWPHMLVRALLAEQLYRASAILSGHPYHRE